jgi:hypothetical protein
LTLSVNSPVKPTDAAEIDSVPFSGAFENERRQKLQKTFHGLSQISADIRRICMETTFLPTSPSRTLSCMVFALIAITGCTTSPNQVLMSPGMVSSRETSGVKAAEILVEGRDSDGDGNVIIGNRIIVLSNPDYVDLMAIANVALSYRDFELAYAANILAIEFCPVPLRYQPWEQFTRIFDAAPLGGQVALSELLSSDIVNHESGANGLDTSSSIAIVEVSRTAMSYLSEGESGYQNAKGWRDDDEDAIMNARLVCLGAGALNRIAPASDVSMRVENLMAATRSDLWEGQANSVMTVFDNDCKSWRYKFQAAQLRAQVTMSLYELGMQPSAPQFVEGGVR